MSAARREDMPEILSGALVASRLGADSICGGIAVSGRSEKVLWPAALTRLKTG